MQFVESGREREEGYPELWKKEREEDGKGGGSAGFLEVTVTVLFERVWDSLQHGVCQTRIVQDRAALLAASIASGGGPAVMASAVRVGVLTLPSGGNTREF